MHTYEISTIAPAHGGLMVAKPEENPVIFVRGALPHERVEVAIVERKKSFWRAEVTKIIEPNPHRIAYRCLAAARGAGCCDYAYTTGDYSRELKQQVCRELLWRIARYYWEGTIETLEPADEHWRVRGKLLVNPHKEIGIQVYRSYEIIRDTPCMQYPITLLDRLPYESILEQADAYFSSVSQSRSVPKRRKSAISQQQVVRHEENLYLHILADAQQQRHIILRYPSRDYTVIEGEDRATMQIKNIDFPIPIYGFWQSHCQAANYLTTHVLDLIYSYDLAVERVWDMYCGVGIFAFTIADKYRQAQVIGVDTSETVMSFAQRSEGRVLGICSTVEHMVLKCSRIDDRMSYQKFKRCYDHPQLIIADPPRQGLGTKVARQLAHMHAQAIILISCDIASCARDLSVLCSPESTGGHGKYTISELKIIDAFPGTDHVECIVLLQWSDTTV